MYDYYRDAVDNHKIFFVVVGILATERIIDLMN